MDNNEHIELLSAVAASCDIDKRITAAIGAVRNWYIGKSADEPSEDKLISRVMACEENGASEALESFLNAVKNYQIGKVPPEPISNFFLSANGLLTEFTDLAELLPHSVHDQAQQLIKDTEIARDIEGAMRNLILAKSGAGIGCGLVERFARFDKKLGKLKGAFSDMRATMACLESDIRGGIYRRAAPRPQKRVRTERELRLAADKSDIGREVCRRKVELEERDKKRYGGEGKRPRRKLKHILAELCQEENWRERCEQWEFPTLYDYVRQYAAKNAQKQSQEIKSVLPIDK